MIVTCMRPWSSILRLGDDARVWVHVASWLLADEEFPRPDAGQQLRSVGLRVRGQVTAAEDGTPDGIVEESPAQGATQGSPVYQLTGVASEGRAVWARPGPPRTSPHHVGAEFVLTVSGERFQVQHDARGSGVVENSRVTVIGPLELVGGYEWEDFGLIDTRTDWLVEQVVELHAGDVLVDLSPSGPAPR